MLTPEIYKRPRTGFRLRPDEDLMTVGQLRQALSMLDAEAVVSVETDDSGPVQPLNLFTTLTEEGRTAAVLIRPAAGYRTKGVTE